MTTIEVSPETWKMITKLLQDKKELLAALETAVSCMSCYIPKTAKGYKNGCFNYVAGGSDMWDCSCPICKARTAIAKAKGAR